MKKLLKRTEWPQHNFFSWSFKISVNTIRKIHIKTKTWLPSNDTWQMIKTNTKREKMPSEMQVAPRHTLLNCWHCFHCLYYSNCFTLLRVMLQNVRTLLEWDDELLGKKWVEVDEWLLDTPRTVLTTRAPVMLTKTLQWQKTHHVIEITWVMSRHVCGNSPTKAFSHLGNYNLIIMMIKMAIILPTGQWYAPSAVINDAWYCMVLHGIAWYCMVLHCIA